MRVARGKTQTQVAEAAGLFQSRVSEIERDAYSPGLELAESLARGLDAPLSDLIAVCEGRLSVEKVAVIHLHHIPESLFTHMTQIHQHA